VTCSRLWMSVADSVVEPKALVEASSSAVVTTPVSPKTRSNAAALAYVAAVQYRPARWSVEMGPKQRAWGEAVC
jgi:hypothetical protein